MRNIRKIATYIIIGTLTLAGGTVPVKASETPVAGFTLTLDEFYQNSINPGINLTQLLAVETKPEYLGLAFAQVSNYVNVRSKASEDSEILGKLYNKSAATILEKENDWYKVKSGTITGYIKAEYLVTGKKADKLSKSTGIKLATVNTTTLKVREKASENSSILTLIPMGEEYEVIKESDGWVKISIDQTTTGYVSADYVKIRSEYEEAISVQEEQQRIEAEAAEARSLDHQTEVRTRTNKSTSNKSKKSAKSSSVNKTSNPSTSQNISSSSSDTSSKRNQIVNYALKFKGNPYQWGGTSLTRGADCSGFTQSVFRDNGISIPRDSRSQAAGGKTVSMNSIQPGDLIFYRRNGRINHVALYIGNGKVISAKSESLGIQVNAYNYRTPYKAVTYIR